MRVAAVTVSELPEVLVLQAKLQGALATLRPAHPVSILDVSPGVETGIALTRLARQETRRLRFMTYAWSGDKPRESFGGPPEPMVEKGALPGLHFSRGSFDFVVGVDVLGRMEPRSRSRCLGELAATALRAVWLVESPGDGVRESDLRDCLLEAAVGPGSVSEVRGVFVVEWAPGRAA